MNFIMIFSYNYIFIYSNYCKYNSVKWFVVNKVMLFITGCTVEIENRVYGKSKATCLAMKHNMVLAKLSSIMQSPLA